MRIRSRSRVFPYAGQSISNSPIWIFPFHTHPENNLERIFLAAFLLCGWVIPFLFFNWIIRIPGKRSAWFLWRFVTLQKEYSPDSRGFLRVMCSRFDDPILFWRGRSSLPLYMTSWHITEFIHLQHMFIPFYLLPGISAVDPTRIYRMFKGIPAILGYSVWWICR